MNDLDIIKELVAVIEDITCITDYGEMEVGYREGVDISDYVEPALIKAKERLTR